MHPDYLPTPTRTQRLQTLAVRVLLSPLLRLVWTVLALGCVKSALNHLFPAVALLPPVRLEGTLLNALVAVAVLWASVRVLEGKSLAAVGLSPEGAALRFGKGYLVGAGLLTAVLGSLFLLGSYRVVGFGPGASLGALGHSALLFLVVGVFEEIVARGIFFRLLEQALGSWAALGLSALLFGFGHSHNPGASWLSSTAIALEAGFTLGAAYLATRSLWFVIGLHAAWNFFEGPVYGATVSGFRLPSLLDARFPGADWLTGGAFGPEAGLPAIVLGTGLGVAFLLLAQRRRQLTTPPWLRKLLRLDGPRPASPHQPLASPLAAAAAPPFS